MRLLAIGDIHGCHQALVGLLEAVRPSPADCLIFLGDYIDRGPASRQVLDTLLELKDKCSPVFLRGNHEVMILEAREDPLKAHLWQSYGGLEALYSYGAVPSKDWIALVPNAHWSFFESTCRYFETDKHIFVHACLDPELELADQPDWLLFWEFFDRLRPHKSGRKIICGHSPQHNGVIYDIGYAACIDTAPGSGGWLTCLEVNTGRFWQSNEKGSVRDGTL